MHRLLQTTTALAALVVVLTASLPAQGPQQVTSWPGFRGPNHDGVSLDAKPPTKWSDDENILWKVELPGPGSSSPVVAGGRIYVASYSGYGKYLDDGGDKSKLVHHLTCFAQLDGKQLWSKSVPGPLQEEARQMHLTEHGFASPTPIVGKGKDGVERVFAYFGRAGVVAYGLDGKQLWLTDLGKPSPDAPAASNQVERNGRVLSLKWGSAASPVLHDGLLFVNCSEESNSIRALNQETGELVWKHESANLEGTAVTPVVFGEAGQAILIMVLGGEIWGMEPNTGEFVWKIKTETAGGMSSTPISDGHLAYVFGGDDISYAIRYGRLKPLVSPIAGEEPKDPRIAWTSKSVAIPSPSLYKGKLLAVRSNGFGLCLDPKTGKVLHDKRLDGRTSGVYASPVIANDHCYVVSRKRGTYVYSADGKFDLIARNELSDKSQFNASPALSGSQMFLRSDKFLYCISE